MKSPWLYLILLFQVFFTTSQAAEIEETLPGGLLARADYQPGATSKPAILLMHGFMTTHHFNLIMNIANELAGNQYTVLSPTLTLGINGRNTSLDCKAIHAHTMESDTREIEWWVNWLIRKGHKKIIIMGHSSGAVQIMEYARNYQHPELVAAIGISMIPLADKLNIRLVESIKKAEQMLARKDQGIANFTLAYCIDSYSAPAREFLSYAQLNAAYILQLMKSSKLPKHVIMGGNDIPVYTNWVEDLGKTGARVAVIKDADHFFNDNAEFALYDKLLDTLGRME